MTRSLPGTTHAATTQKAAWDGSPGTSSSNGWRAPGRRRTVRPSSSRVRSAPAAASISSVWARVRTARGPPSRPRRRGRRAGSPTSPGRWPPAGRSRCRVRSPPRTTSGGRLPPSRPSTRGAHQPQRPGHPVHRPAGDRLVAAEDGEPVEGRAQAGQQPDGGAGVADVDDVVGLVQRLRPPVTRSPSTTAPRASTAAPGAADVVAGRQPPHDRRPLGQRAQHQGPVGDGLVARHPHSIPAAAGRR